jgi:transposase
VATTFVAGKDQRPVKVFFEDEARFGRINIVGRCWVAKSARAVVSQQMIREYLYAYTTVCPQTGENYSIISPVNNTEAMNIFLEAFAKAYGHYRIILCLDGAGWHISKSLTLPENIQFLRLPPYSPELNPAEHIWDYIREQKKFNNYTFDTLEDVENQLSEMLRQLNGEKDILKSMCGFKWLTYSS